MKKSLAILLTLVLCVSVFAGCSGGDTKLTGKYILVEMKGEGEDEEVNLSELKAMYEMFEMEWVDPYIEFLDGGKFKMVFFDEVNEEGTYKVVDGGKAVEMTVDGETQKGTIDGKKISLGDDEMTMVFEKK